MADSAHRTRYVVLARLPRQLEVRIEDTFLTRAGATKPTMGYHVTLAGPFWLADDAGPESMACLAELTMAIDRMTVRVSGLGAFEAPDDNTVYLHVQYSPALWDLRDQIVEAVAPCAEFASAQVRVWNYGAYHPHVTLGITVSDRELAEFWNQTDRSDAALSFDVSSVWLAEQVHNGPWQHVAEYPLGGMPAISGTPGSN